MNMLIEVRVLRVIMRSRHALIHDKRDACRSSVIATHRSGCLFNKWTTVINLNWWSAIIELLVTVISYINYKASGCIHWLFWRYI